ncbi:MAG: CHAT domain-containing protein [Vicinamibacteria bacterium]
MVSIEYRDLHIALWTDVTPGLFRARAEEEFGRATPPTKVYLPFDDRWFVQYADRVEELNSRELHYVGARLFDALFQDEILRLYVHLLQQIRNTGAKLRVRLAIDPPIVARLPWECLYDTRNGKFIGTMTEVTLVRYVRPAAQEPPSLPARPPLKVLLVADPATERIQREAETVRGALAPLEAEGAVSVFEAGSAFGGPALGAESFESLVARTFDVLHVVGDGVREGVEGPEARIVLGKESFALSGLARLLQAHPPGLVVWSGGREAGVIGPSLAESILGTVPALLAQRETAPDLLAPCTTALYRSLGAMQPIDAALADARTAVLAQFPGETEWVSPALYLSRKDATILFHPARGTVQDVYQLSEGRYRRSLREALNRFWPKPERYFPQLLQWLPRKEPLANYLHAAEFLGQPHSASELNQRFQRLLLLGPAGSGKTMALYRLFYEAAQPVLSYEAKSPLPVYVSLPDLQHGGDLFTLLASDLDRDLFRSDLEEGRFLFLMDSLEGLSARSAIHQADALNQFMRLFPLNRFVVAARLPSPRPVDISNWAEVLPLAEWEAIDFLVAGSAIRPEAARILYAQLTKALGSRVGNPQVLALARRLWREGARIPSTATEIFLSFLRVAGETIAAETRDGLLPQLAFFMTKEGRLSLVKEHLEEDRRPRGLSQLAQEVAFRSTGATSVDELLAEVEKTRLLRGPRAFSFPNIAFQEFLTAYALRLAAPNTIMSLVPYADWRELDGTDVRPLNMSRGPFHGAIPFLCGLREDGPKLVERLVERDLVLAAASYRECRPSMTVDLALRAGVERTLASSLELDQRIACMSLEARGDRWAVDWLEEMAGRSGSAARTVALEALGNLRSRRSVSVLESAAEDRDPTVAKAAFDALTRIKAG